jgi:hypothetical protein
VSETLPGRPQNTLRLCFLISLGVNLLLLAFLAVQAGRRGFDGHHAPGGHSVEQMFHHVEAVLSPADAGLLRQAVQTHQADLTASQQDLDTAAYAVRAALAAEPFSLDTLRATMQAAHAARQHLGELVEVVTLESVPVMSPQGRVILSRSHAH